MPHGCAGPTCVSGTPRGRLLGSWFRYRLVSLPPRAFHHEGWSRWLSETNSFISAFPPLHLTLTSITITTNVPIHPDETVELWDKKVPSEVLSEMRSDIPPSLQCLDIYLRKGGETCLAEDISTFVPGCGESLQTSHTNLVSSTEAIVRLPSWDHRR
jgi:hypothetical protein